MSKNTFVKNKKETNKDTSKMVKGIGAFLSGSFFSKEAFIASIPYLLFLSVLGVLYIANGYYTEKIVRKIAKTGTEIKELRSEYITLKSDLNYKSKQSQVAQATKEMGLKESVTPPNKIVVTQKEFQNITFSKTNE
ncbi:MAG: hypothetical protein Kow0079_01560 [Vicingaceae bacterium]